MSVTTAPTVERAIEVLASGSLFADYDVDFGHRIYESLNSGNKLTPTQRSAARRMLRRYATVLAEHGIDYSAIPESDPDVATEAPLPKDAVVVKVFGDHILVASPYKYKDVCKTIPGARWDKVNKAWSYGASHTAAASIAEAFANAALVPDDAFKELLAKAGTLAESAVHKEATDLPPVPVTNTDAWLHQRQAFHFAQPMPAVMLAMDMGTGKSKVAVDLVVNNDAERVLVLCPKSVVNVWPREFRIHAGRDYHVEALTGGPKQSVAQRRDIADHALHECDCGKPHAIVINYEGARLEPFATWALEQEWDYLILDESHRIKAYNGKTSKLAWKLGKRARRRLALTGTPMGQSPLDVFSQYRAIDPDVFGTSFFPFRNRYAVMGGYGGHEIVGYQRLDELNRKFYSLAYRVDAEVLDLPESLDLTRGCTLEPKAAALYNDMEKAMIAEVEGGSITARNVLTQLLRLQQLTGGSVTNDDGDLIETDTSKADLLEDVLDDLEVTEPVVVFCRFRHDLDVVKRIAEKTGRRYGEISGRSKSALNSDAKMVDDIDIAAVQISSGGVGVDLTRARIAIYYSLGFSLTDYLQSRRRVLRPGQDREVLFVHLVSTGTVDEKVYDALSRREEVVNFVLGEAGGKGALSFSADEMAERIAEEMAGEWDDLRHERDYQ